MTLIKDQTMLAEARIYLEQLEAFSEAIDAELSSLPEGRLYARPGPSLNSIGWNYWHLLRIWDYDLNWAIRGRHPLDDLWHRQSFSARSGYNPDGKGTDGNGLGSRYRDFEVDELNIPLELLREYHDALLVDTTLYLQETRDRELRQRVIPPSDPNNPQEAANRIRHTIGQAWMHLGELRYARGCLTASAESADF
jgi:DinB superfamily